MTKKIFISRVLAADSPIIKVAKDHNIIAKSLITFKGKAFDPPQADWIFFYSRNGVKYFFKNGNYELYPYLWACLSQGTADELSQYIIDPFFVGKGDLKDIAHQFENTRNSNEITCFVRAENSKDSIKKLIDKDLDFSLPVYENKPIDLLPDGQFDILIFTSPINVNTWFDHRKYVGETVICIGKTTAKALAVRGIDNVKIASETTEISLAERLSECL